MHHLHTLDQQWSLLNIERDKIICIIYVLIKPDGSLSVIIKMIKADTDVHDKTIT